MNGFEPVKECIFQYTDAGQGAVLWEQPIVRCKDCKHSHITVDGRSNKWCNCIATHSPEDWSADPPNGYDPEPYFDADFFCAWGEKR